MKKSDDSKTSKYIALALFVAVILFVCACRGTSAPSFYYNESYYHICGSGESPILKECGLPLEITSDLAGTFISYLEPGSDNTYLFTETDTGTILYEYGPDPNENVYIVLLDRRYFAAIRCDADGHHGLPTESTTPTNADQDEPATISEKYKEGDYVGFFASSFPFDYDCYVQKYEKTGEDTGLLYVTPIAFIWEEDMEDRKTYGLNDEDFYPTGYVIIDDTTETVGLKTNSDTRYLLVNWRHEQELIDVSDNKSAESVYCVISDPEYFMSYFSEEYGDKYNHYPMFIVMDENGYVKLVVEAFLT